MSDLASLVVSLTAETSQYSAAIQKATDQIGGFSDSVGSAIADVAKNLLALEALKQVFDFTDNIVKTVANFDVLSHALGGSTESLSQLTFAAKLFNVDDISFAMERLARAVGAVETGNQKTIGVFNALGVSINDAGGKVKGTEKQLLDIADAVSKYNDGLSKTAAVQQIFGRSGADFIAFLDQGAAKIKEAQQEAIDLGVSVSAPAAIATHEFEQDTQRIEAALQGIFFRTLQEILPQFQQLADSIVEFAKHADNTQTIVSELAAGLKIIGSTLIIVGTAFTVVGQILGEFVGSITLEIGALADLAKAFTDPVGAMKDFAKEQVGVLQQIGNAFVHPVDSAKKFISDTQDTLSGIDNVLEHPIDSIHKFFQTQKDAVSGGSDVLATLRSGLSALNSMWGDANSQLNEIAITAKKLGKPDIVLPDNTALKATETAIDALAKLDDKLKEQVATFGLSGAAATVYDVTLGKLSASIDEVNRLSPTQAQAALAALEKQGKLTQTQIEQINTAIAHGVPIGDAFKKSTIDEATALEQLKAVDALSKLDVQLLTITGHLEEAGKAAFDLANRPLRITIQTQQDTQAFKGLDDAQKQIEVTTQINALNQQAIEIKDALGKKITDVDAAALTSGEGNLQLAGEEAVARQNAISQLETLFVKAQALANATGLKSAAVEAKALQTAIGQIQFNPKIVQDVDAATAAQKKFNESMLAQKNINDDLSLQIADLAKLNSQGALSDLDYLAKQDDARQHAIDQLMAQQKVQLDIIASNPGNAQALDDYKKLSIQIDSLQTQMGQLAKTIRTDLTDDAANAFVGFATGAESAKKAAQSFVADFEKQMLQLAAKELFQKLFDATGISAGIDALFGGATKAATGAASGAATGTAIGTAMTAAATASGVTIGGAVEASGTLAATAMGTAIETSGSAAAAQMAAAIAGSGAASGASAATVVALAAAGGGPIPANQLTLVGEEGPELYVSDLGTQTAAVATRGGTVVPDDLTHAEVIGKNGPEYIKPGASGFVVPSDTFLQGLSDRAAPVTSTHVAAVHDGKLRTASDGYAVDETASDGYAVDETASVTADSQRKTVPKGTTADERLLASVTDLTPLIVARLPALPSTITPQTIPQPVQPESANDQLFHKIAVAAEGGPVYAGQTIHIGEQGPELLVSDSGGETALSATRNGTHVPLDFSTSQLIGIHGSGYVTPTTGGYIIPSDVLASQIPTRQQVAGASAYPNASSYMISVNGVETPIGLTETFTTDSQGFTSIQENVNAYVGLLLPAGTLTASGGTTITANDITYPPGGMSPDQFVGIYQPDALQQQQLGVTLASYVAEFSSTPPETTLPASLQIGDTDTSGGGGLGLPESIQPGLLSTYDYQTLLGDRSLPKRAGGGPVSAGTPYLVGEGGPELMVPDSDGTVLNSWQTQNNQVGTVIHQYFNFTVNTPTGKVDRASQGQIAARTAIAAQSANTRNN
jgi:hypothetical protein